MSVAHNLFFISGVCAGDHGVQGWGISVACVDIHGVHFVLEGIPMFSLCRLGR